VNGLEVVDIFDEGTWRTTLFCFGFHRLRYLHFCFHGITISLVIIRIVSLLSRMVAAKLT
jgi:hypothetical protein